MAPQMLWCLVATLVPGIRLWGGSFVRLWVVGLRNPINMIAWNLWKICKFFTSDSRIIFFTFEKLPSSQNTDLYFCCQLATATHHLSQDFGQINDGMETIVEELQGTTIFTKNPEDGHPNHESCKWRCKPSGVRVVTTENHQTVFVIKISGLLPKKKYTVYLLVASVVPQENSKNSSGTPQKILQIASYHVFQDPMFYLQISSKFWNLLKKSCQQPAPIVPSPAFTQPPEV